MRLVWLELRGYRRFEEARINLDAPVIALVGPNEAGKTTLLKALTDLGQQGDFDPRDITRDTDPVGRILEAKFLLNDLEREALIGAVPEASDVRWYCVWRDETGEHTFSTIPEIPWRGEAAERARTTLTKLRNIKWAGTASEDLIDRLDTVLSWFPSSGSTRHYTEDELRYIDTLRADLAEEIDAKTPAMLRRACAHITLMVGDESKPRPQTAALDLLSSRQPSILDFSESSRTLLTSYNLQDANSWSEGLHNLARLARFDLNELAEAVSGSRPEIREDILMNANACLEEVFSVRWSQAQLKVHLGVQGVTLEIFVASDGGGLHRLAERSDGLRTYLALIAFLENRSPTTPPILVFDEAENHLHWDAQADLIKVLYGQDMAPQIIYSTHSPGCLPHDLGHSVRAVVPTAPDRSTVRNWIWESDAGFRPMLIHMGASTAALTPHRYAVGTEGVADFILLPSLIRAATGEDSLPYQVVPGVAQLSRDGLRSIDAESDTMIYLTDGDGGGKQLSKWLRKGGVPSRRIVSLPHEVVLEDLVSAEILVAAIHQELSRSGLETKDEPILPDKGRSAYLDDWFRSMKLRPPSKRAIASRILELHACHPNTVAIPLVASRHRATLKRLHKRFINAFDNHI